jgi:putative membrane protein
MNEPSRPTDATTLRPALCKPPDIFSDDRVLLAWQRSHMANERTFLSWCRTAVSLLAFGFVVEKFEMFLRHIVLLEGGVPVRSATGDSVYLSLFAFGVAGAATLFAGVRFLRVRRHINRGEASYSVVPDILVIAAVTAIIMMALALAFPRLFGSVSGVH